MKVAYRPVLAFLSLPALLIGIVCFHKWWGFLLMVASLTVIVSSVRWALRALYNGGPEGRK